MTPSMRLRQQEGCHSFASGLPAKQQHLLLRRHEFVRRQLQQPLFHRRKIIQQGAQFWPGKPAILHGLDRLGAERVGVGYREAEEMPDPGETGDLPPSVGQQLVKFGGAAGDVEERAGGFAFGDETAAGRGGVRGRCRTETSQFGIRDRIADALCTRTAARACVNRLASGRGRPGRRVRACILFLSAPERLLQSARWPRGFSRFPGVSRAGAAGHRLPVSCPGRTWFSFHSYNGLSAASAL